MNIRINTHGHDLPAKAEGGDWYDLKTVEDVTLKEGEIKTISLGISLEIPEGYTAYILPRSSAPTRFGIEMVNSMGVIENDYSGDGDVWGFPALAMRETIIPRGTRLCQFRLFKSAEPVEFVQVEHLDGPDRGGFGSTGTK